MSKPKTNGSLDVDWAAVCDCGWAASSAGTDVGRLRTEQLGISHATVCDDDVVLERRALETRAIRQLDPWRRDGDSIYYRCRRGGG